MHRVRNSQMGNCCKIVKSKEGETLRLAHTWGAMVGAVMRAVNLHKSDNHSFRPFVQCGVSLLWLIFLPPRVFLSIHQSPSAKKATPPKYKRFRFNLERRITSPVCWAMFTLYRIVFAPTQKPYRIGLLFTHKNRDFGQVFTLYQIAFRAGTQSYLV